MQVIKKLKCLNHCHNKIKSSKQKGLLSWTIAENMRKIVQKNEVSIMKLSARRGLECRILHHLSQSFWVALSSPTDPRPQRALRCGRQLHRPHQFACYFSIFSCYFKIYWHPRVPYIHCMIIFPFDAESSKNNTFLWRHAGSSIKRSGNVVRMIRQMTTAFWILSM